MEEFFTRSDECLTGIEVLDAQHAELAACIRKIADACCDIESTQAVDAISRKQNLSGLVDDLYQMTKQHFEHEEAVMRGAEYPHFAAHRREHTMLLAELKLSINMGRGSEGNDMDSEMLRALKTWFMAHIKHSDCKFSAHISGRGMVSELNDMWPGKTLSD